MQSCCERCDLAVQVQNCGASEPYFFTSAHAARAIMAVPFGANVNWDDPAGFSLGQPEMVALADAEIVLQSGMKLPVHSFVRSRPPATPVGAAAAADVLPATDTATDTCCHVTNWILCRHWPASLACCAACSCR